MSDQKDTVLLKSEIFAVRIVRMYKYLCARHREYELFRQIVRSGTSIGANVTEAQYAITKKDFLSKMYIAMKEANETLYWLKLLYRCDYLTEGQYRSLFADGTEIQRMLSAITKTTSIGLASEQ